MFRNPRSFSGVKNVSRFRRRLVLQRLEERTVPNTYTVMNTNDSGAGSLRQAIIDSETSAGADIIDFDPTTFSAVQTIDLFSAPLDKITQALTIQGPTAKVTIDANNIGRVFKVDASGKNVEFMDLIITGGKVTDENGGGVSIENGNVTFDSCDIVENSASGSSTKSVFGGGIYIFSGSLTMVDCFVDQNKAISRGNGGGIFSQSATVTLSNNCLVSGNVATRFDSFDKSNGFGGGIYVISGPLTITNSSVILNGDPTSTLVGGGLFSKSAVTITNSQFLANNAANGGAMQIESINGSLTMDTCTIDGNVSSGPGGGIRIGASATGSITNSTISNNSAGGFGGGIEIPDGTTNVSIYNCTISGNSAGGDGGGAAIGGLGTTKIWNSTVAFNKAGSNGGGVARGGGTANLDSTIVGNNTASTGPDISSSVTANFTLVSNSAGASLTGSNNQVGFDPMLGPLADNGGPTRTHALMFDPTVPGGSIAVDKGRVNPAISLPNDQRGNPRTVQIIAPSPTTDIGAYEYQQAPQVISVQGLSDPQHSTVRNIFITFNQPVTFSGSTADFTLERVGPGSPTGTVTIGSATLDPTSTFIELTGFSGSLTEFDSLIDGNYKLTVASTSIIGSAFSQALDGDFNGVAGGNFVDTTSIFRLFGDGNGDRIVSAADFAMFRLVYGLSDPTFDFNNDGIVSAADFAAFRLRYGQTLPPA